MNSPEHTSTDRPLGDGRVSRGFERPRSVDALQQGVSQHVANGMALYPQGGCTALDYGGVPGKPGVAIDMSGLDRIIEYPAADMTITVEAGITIAALAEVLKGQGQRLTIDVPEADRATLGGVYATNCSGPRRFGAGRPRDQIIGVSFVTSTGKLVKGGGRVVKNVAGYDFPKLLTGSMGSLGILTQLSLKVRPIPEASALAWVPFGSLDAVESALATLNTSSTRPIAIELLNRQAGEVVGKDSGLPLNDWILVVGFEDNPNSVDWQLGRIPAELGLSTSALAIPRDAESVPLWRRLTEFQNAPLGPLSLVVNVKPSAVVPVCRILSEIPHAIQCHAGNGIIRAHLLGEASLHSLSPRLAHLRREAVRLGGNVVLSRCPTDWKAELPVWGEARGDWPIMREVRRALDPTGSMNPGRFLGMI